MERLPVTILTGFLGAGKTTLLNRILSGDHGKKMCVIVNEFGELGIDQELVLTSDEEVFELNNGCLCCTVRGDLVDLFASLLPRREHFDYVLIETTGVADPSPVVQTFLVDPDLEEELQLDGVVTVVDAKHAYEQLGRSPEFSQQVAFADVLLLNKIDLVEPDHLARLEAEVRQINGVARLFRTEHSGVALSHLIDIGSFELERTLARNPSLLESTHDHHHHRHSDGLSTVSLQAVGDMDPDRFEDWFNTLVAERGVDIFRCKGILSVADDPDRYLLQGVHSHVQGRPGRPWGKDLRENRLVFIGQNLNSSELEDEFLSCLT